MKTTFAKSSRPQPSITGKDGTGNFPIHPNVVRGFLKNAAFPLGVKIMDIGSGSGMALHVMYQEGYKNLCGIELNPLVAAASERNLPVDIKIIQGNAIDLNLEALAVECIFMFNPFRGETLKAFLKKIPVTVKTVIAINCDPLLPSVLVAKNFKVKHAYKSRIYKNFSGQIWEINSET